MVPLYAEMVQFDWVPKTTDPKEKVIYLRKFFEVVELTLLENNQLMPIACRRLAVTEKSDLALMAWSQEARIKAREITTEPINVKELITKISDIREMTTLKPENFCPKLKRCLADCGIALVFLPHLKGSFLHGATFLAGNKIVIGLTARGKDADKFWFSLFHELAHIILGHIGRLNGISREEEECADGWARDVLIEKGAFEDFCGRGDYSRQSIIQFATEQKIAPGIVVGRMQVEGILDYSMMNQLKEKYEIAV